MAKDGGVCPVCRGRFARRKEPYWFGNMKLGEFDADVCTKCGEIFYTEEASGQIDKKAKGTGVWGIGKKVVIGQSGNALVLRIPKTIAQLYKLHKSETALVFPEGRNKIAIEIEE